MGGLGSNPSMLLVLVAFAVLVIVRSAGLVLGNTKPEVATTREGKETLMIQVARSLAKAAFETAWALGTSVLAGLPLLT